MAVAVDSFEFLSRELLDILSSVKETLAFIGIYYTTRKVLSITWACFHSVKVHGLSKLRSVKFSEKYGPWAVITGSTHGIGKAFAQELASAGVNIIIVSIDEADCEKVSNMLVVTGCTSGIGSEYCTLLAHSSINLVLVSRDVNKLQNLALRLENNYGIKTHIIAVDFNDGRPVYEEIKKGIQDKEIGILVNNVGVMYDYPQHFLEVPYDKLWQLVHVNVAAATMMTHIVLPQMVERKRGAVITVSSGASALPTPQMAIYSATKAYLDYFSRALRYEYKDQGITVQCLLPFYVATRMTQYSSTLSRSSLLIPTASTYARHALQTLGWSDRTTGYWPHTVQMWISNLIPEWLWYFGATRLNNALRRQAHQRIRSRTRSESRSRHGSGSSRSRHASGNNSGGSRRGSLQATLVSNIMAK